MCFWFDSIMVTLIFHARFQLSGIAFVDFHLCVLCKNIVLLFAESAIRSTYKTTSRRRRNNRFRLKAPTNESLWINCHTVGGMNPMMILLSPVATFPSLLWVYYTQEMSTCISRLTEDNLGIISVRPLSTWLRGTIITEINKSTR